jgi:hypothetical protein
MIVGALEGLILVYVIFGVVSLISPMLTNTAIVDSINDSFFGKMMYNNNVVVKYIYNGTKLDDSSENKADQNNTTENDTLENGTDENSTNTSETENTSNTSENENKAKE